MLGKYRRRDFTAGGNREFDSCIAIKGGLNEHRLGSANTGYSRLEDPFIPFITIDVDFTYSAFFGDMQKIINVPPREYAAYLDSCLVSKYKAMMDASENNKGIELTANKYNLDMNYLEPTASGISLSATEWLYMKLCGVPSIDGYTDTSDLNAPAAETDTDKYDDEVEAINEKIKDLLNMLSAATDPYEAENIRYRIADLEEERARALDNKQQVEDSAITLTPTTQPTFNSVEITGIEDARVSDFIRSCKMFYEMVTKHSYMITSIDLGDIITTYYQDENNFVNVKFNMRLGETVDMKASRMMHGFMNAVYDTTYMREFIPMNLRKFNMTLYIHDARSFLNNTPAGAMLRRAKNNNIISQINSLAAEHTATMAICLMGCRFVNYINNFNSIQLSGPSVGPSQDVIDITMEADMASIYMTDIHDLVHGA